MDHLLLAIAAIFLMCIASTLAWISQGGKSILSPLFAFVITSIIFINIGFLLRFLDSSADWAGWALLSVTIGLFTISVAGALCFLLIKGFVNEWSVYPTRPVVIDMRYDVAVVTSILLFALISMHYYFLGFVPVLSGWMSLLTSGFSEGLINSFRINADPLFNPGAEVVPLAGLFDVLRNLGTSICVVWFLHFRRKGIHPNLSLILIFCCGLAVIASGQRWPLMYMLLSYLFYRSWNEPDPRRVKKIITKVLVVGVVLGILLSSLLGRRGEEGLSPAAILKYGVVDLADRLFLNQSMGPFTSYEIFSSPEARLHGGSYVQNLASLLPGKRSAGAEDGSLVASIFAMLPDKQDSFPVTFYEIVIGTREGFTSPPDLYTEAFLNFGLLGAVFVPLLWAGLLIYSQYRLLSRRTLKKQGYDCILAATLAFSSISGPSYTINVLIAIAILEVLRRIAYLILPTRLERAYHVSSP